MATDGIVRRVERWITRALDGLATFGEKLGAPAAEWHDWLGERASMRYEAVLREQKAAREWAVKKAQAEADWLARAFPGSMTPPNAAKIRATLAESGDTYGFNGKSGEVMSLARLWAIGQETTANAREDDDGPR